MQEESGCALMTLVDVSESESLAKTGEDKGKWMDVEDVINVDRKE